MLRLGEGKVCLGVRVRLSMGMLASTEDNFMDRLGKGLLA